MNREEFLEFITEQGVSMSEIARRLDVSPASVNLKLRGKHTLSKAELGNMMAVAAHIIEEKSVCADALEKLQKDRSKRSSREQQAVAEKIARLRDPQGVLT